jgi:hypothetical protein
MMASSDTFGPAEADKEPEDPVRASPLEDALDVEELDSLLDAGPLGEAAVRPIPAPDDELDAT